MFLSKLPFFVCVVSFGFVSMEADRKYPIPDWELGTLSSLLLKFRVEFTVKSEHNKRNTEPAAER